MRRAAGFTLVELMVTVAVMGISAATVMSAGTSMREAAAARVLHEQASQVLDYEAREVSEGRVPDPAVELQLGATLPQMRVQRERTGKVTTIRVHWHQLGSEHERHLAVFAKGVH